MRIYSKVYLPSKKLYKKYVDRIYEKSWVTNNGELKEKLEKKLEKFLSVKNLILVSSGTIGLQIAYKVLGLSGNVITTPFSYVATSNTLIWDGLKPKFVDIKKDSLNIDVSKINSKIDKKTSAILPVHVFGNPCNIFEINRIAKEKKLKIIYDASHCFNTFYKGKSVLNYGDISVMSLHATKIFHTIEGGAIITKSDQLAKKIRMMINFGKDQEDNYKILGINAKMNEFEAAMGLSNLSEFKKIIKYRKEIWVTYKKYLADFFQLQDLNLNSNPNYSYFPIIFKNEKKLLNAMYNLEKNNIFVRRYFYPSLDQIYANKNYGICPNSREISKKILCLPISNDMTKINQLKIIEILKLSQIKNN